MKESNLSVYKEARRGAGCSQNDWARIFALQPLGLPKHRQKGQPNVAAKESGRRGVNDAENLASQLLLHLSELGYDVKNIQFDIHGKIEDIPKRK